MAPTPGKGRTKAPSPKNKAKKARPPSRPQKRRGRGGSARKPARRGGLGRRALIWLLRGIGRPIGWVGAYLWAFFWRAALVAGVIVAFTVAHIAAGLPDVNALLDGRARGSVTLLDHQGRIFAWRGSQFGGVVSADSISPHLKNAILATEDKRFYSHFGVSPRGVASAIRINLGEGRGPLSGHGGSTITQQTAKLLCLGRIYDPTAWESENAYITDCRRSSLGRKLHEALYALAMEWHYQKDDILSIYLNRAYMGAGAYGVEAAAQRYFGISAAQVNPAQAAMLAGLLTAPSILAPTSDLKRAQDRAATVLRLMGEQGYLSRQEVAQWQSTPAELGRASVGLGTHFADWLMGAGPEFLTYNTTEDVVLHTTLDLRIQQAAQQGLRQVFETMVRQGSRAQAAVVVLSASGAVRAMIGGRNMRIAGGFNRAVQARRQPGSAFKPFVYAAALEAGHRPNDRVQDEPFCLTTQGGKHWCPRNYTGEYHGRVSLARAFYDSLNGPAVRLAEAIGRDAVRRVANGFGLQDALAEGPALALGVSEHSLLEMTAAYAGVLNGGVHVPPYGLRELRVQGVSEPLLRRDAQLGDRVISQAAARDLIAMMRQVVERGTGQRAALPGWQVAGKTGTTQAARDAWFIGFSADYVVGVWMGYDDNTPLTGVTGGGLPAEIWRQIMERILGDRPPKPLPGLAALGR
ncbi:MAG: transglycosylase domain-containing protein [Rhodobacteraceae bacterium]|nr:transglycosylase domain-containing protein [Paracoccaceae bacterium]